MQAFWQIGKVGDMGAVSFSIDMRLVQCPYRYAAFDAVRGTGTFRGDTVAQVRRIL